MPVRCREIGSADVDRLVDLFTRGFRIRPREFWVRAFTRLTERPALPGYPRYGYLLEADGAPVGAILLIFSSSIVQGQPKIRCNVSSWYAEPAFASYAAMLVSHALRDEQVTYFNITPSSHTLPILGAQGYKPYSGGRYLVVPMLSAPSVDTRIEALAPGVSDADLPTFETELLLDHAGYGCISLVCRAPNQRYPFVFLPLRTLHVIPVAYLAYCRDLDNFVRFAGALGRFLARRGFPLVVLDSTEPVQGLYGKYMNGHRNYFKGPDRPRLGDIAYSERVMFGF